MIPTADTDTRALYHVAFLWQQQQQQMTKQNVCICTHKSAAVTKLSKVDIHKSRERDRKTRQKSLLLDWNLLAMDTALGFVVCLLVLDNVEL